MYKKRYTPGDGVAKSAENMDETEFNKNGTDPKIPSKPKAKTNKSAPKKKKTNPKLREEFDEDSDYFSDTYLFPSTQDSGKSTQKENEGRESDDDSLNQPVSSLRQMSLPKKPTPWKRKRMRLSKDHSPTKYKKKRKSRQDSDSEFVPSVASDSETPSTPRKIGRAHV